ncbi:MAG: apolipoprotein N-acyltransferase [Burkholderiales bacterium]|nr:MAG: apolipoprotein N-acyltransferase [Burkholderiales bacterium]
MAGGARLARSRWSGIALAALLCAVYAQGGLGWVLGIVAWVPWLRTLDGERSLRGTLLSAWAMSVGYMAAVLAWFGAALGTYTQIGDAAGLALLLLAAPLLQPQILAFALVRRLARSQHGAAFAAVAAAAAWVATEWMLPHGLGGTFGHGLYPSDSLRQAAAWIGGSGLTAALLLANEALATTWAHRRAGLRAAAPSLAWALLLPLLLAAIGTLRSAHDEPPATTVRLGLVQANITGYEQRRREQGAEGVVREVLGTHFAMSYDAIEHQQVDAVLWSETVYPTTFGRPKSEAGADLDAEILATMDAAGVPFVFGTYDRDETGEYNAAAFVQPGAGVIGRYRKTRLFPFTEALPAWLDVPVVRTLLPAAGQWRPGDGARVFPLRLKNGREVPVLPLICLDDTDPRLAIDGARLGAQLILTMSNDEWFTRYPQGAALHQAVAIFRSIETGLPQFRVTTNGLSAVIDARGRLLATSRMGERTLVIGELPARDPAPTLMVRWGDWVGRAAATLLAAWALWAAAARIAPARSATAAAVLPVDVTVLSPATRAVTAALRLFSRGGALAIGAAWLLGDTTITGNTLALLRTFVALCLLPEVIAGALLRSSRARLQLQDGVLQLQRGARTLTLPLADIASVAPWRLPCPAEGASLRLHTGRTWPHRLSLRNPWALAAALGLPLAAAPGRLATYARARATGPRSRLGHPVLTFGLLPLLLAVPAFTLHQNIAFGSPFGEFHSFGLTAYLQALALWWAAWAVGVVVCSVVVRATIEAVAAGAALVQPEAAPASRATLERLGLLILLAGMPTWLLVRATI